MSAFSKWTPAELEAHQAKVAAGKRLKHGVSCAGLPLVHLDELEQPKTPPKPKQRSRKGYDVKVVLAYFKANGIPEPEVEYRFHSVRKWRFDFAWRRGFCNTLYDTALEVDGGIWINGGHNRGAQMLATWEKENEAVCMGWRILRCQPKDLLTLDMVNLIKRALRT